MSFSSSATYLAGLQDASTDDDSASTAPLTNQTAISNAEVMVDVPRVLVDKAVQFRPSAECQHPAVFAVKQPSGRYEFLSADLASGQWRLVDQPQNPGTAAIWLPEIHPRLFLTNRVGAFRGARSGGGASVVIAADPRTCSAVDPTKKKTRRKRTSAASAGSSTSFACVIVADSTGLDAETFFHKFFLSGSNVLKAMGDGRDEPVFVACAAGMNRSCTTIIFYMLLRAYLQPQPWFAEAFGSGPHFDVGRVVAYLRAENLVARYPVLTNLQFVEYLHEAAAFFAETMPSKNKKITAGPRGSRLVRDVRVRDAAATFAAFVQRRRDGDSSSSDDTDDQTTNYTAF
jgi:hypothetical protein